MTIPQAILFLTAAYLALGLAFSIIFIRRGLARVDPATRNAPLGFFLLILPGLSALWPILLRKWLAARHSPVEHRP
jgi:hypothetical protein